MDKASGGDGTPAELFHILKDDAVKVLHAIYQQVWKIQQWPQDWKRSVFILIPKKDNAKECSNYCTIVLISHASKIMLKILQAGLQQYMNWGFPDVQAGFGKGRGSKDEIASICRIIEKAREFQKNICFCFIDYTKALIVGITTNCGQFLKRWEYQTTYLRNLYAGQETIVRTRHGTMDWLKIEKAIWQGCVLSLCFFNLYAEWKWKFLSHLQLFVTPWTIESMEFSRPEYWSG